MLSVVPSLCRSTASIRAELPQPAPTDLAVFNRQGQRVRTLFAGRQGKGRFDLTWDGTDRRGIPVNSGVYVVRLVAGRQMASQKVLILRE
jgi:flagellar hook assembly protein FlgD